MPAPPEEVSSQPDPRIVDALHDYWGFETFRPLQREAIDAGISQQDSLVVMPTGGGKSLCYQIPPLIDERMDIVISPLISLMKDQVDGLRQNGYPAAALHSSVTPAEREQTREMIRNRSCRLLFVTPERMLTERFLRFVDRMNVRTFAIDEAHCISQWGHDFRQEYRELRRLRELFPDAGVHAYTATATPRVQQDIVDQLGLRNPRVLIGTFDRPNLVYRVLPKTDVDRQVLEIVRRHAGEATIVYCISRKDTETLAEFLTRNGIRAAPYHAGLEKPARSHTQEAFAAEKLDVVVATVAFGMGIDRSNVRCVIHAAMPKTIEHYQQETGRAGRDGLEAECVLLYSGSDCALWERLIRRSAMEAPDPEAVVDAQTELLRHMQHLCGTLECRHRALSRYFGQQYAHENCNACDVCLGEVEGMTDANTIAQKIISCVYRTGQSYGIGYINEVLRGARTAAVLQRQHDQLSTFGILSDLHAKTITNLAYQLIDQGLLERTGGDRPFIQLNEESLSVLRGQREVRLIEPDVGPIHRTRTAEAEWRGVDRALFEQLRMLRQTIAQEQGVPAFVVFSDSTLREMARSRPTSRKHFTQINGVGERKLAAYGERFVNLIEQHCREQELETDVDIVVQPIRPRSPRPNPRKACAMKMFSEGASLDEVVEAISRARSTVAGYLVEWIEHDAPDRINAWVNDDDYQRIVEAIERLGDSQLRPLYDEFEGELSYETLKFVAAHHATVSQTK